LISDPILARLSALAEGQGESSPMPPRIRIMNAPLHPSFTNEVAPEFLRSLNDSPFTEQQLAGFSEQPLLRVK